MGKVKRCQFCREVIRAELRFCPYCYHDTVKMAEMQTERERRRREKYKYDKKTPPPPTPEEIALYNKIKPILEGISQFLYMRSLDVRILINKLKKK